MIKLVSPDSFGFDQPTAAAVKVASRGLRGTDLDRFVKRAAAGFLGALEELRPGEVPVHVIGVGAKEYYGFNRNGDAFDVQTCRDHHDTFRKYGHYFHDHVNKDPRKNYGRIIKTAYSESMHRIELLVGLNGDEAAARANGGLVATRDLEKLARGEDLPVSMACHIAHDVCEFCGNKARSRDEYCDTGPVKYAGRTIAPCSGFGCRRGLTKVARDGRMQGVDNPNARWFDMSGVLRNADRIAYGLGILTDDDAGGAAIRRGSADPY